MLDTVSQCEREVELARAKLKKDLGTLRSPETLSSFTDELKAEAFEAKDAVVEHAKDAVRTSVEGIVDDIKARAAANPAAALAIGAGIAWQLLRHPPIASLLVGAGVLSLWRTSAPATHGWQNSDYLEEGRQRLKEQVSEFGAEASNRVAQAGRAIAKKADQASASAIATAQEWSRETVENVADLTARATAKAQDAIAFASNAVSDASERAAATATDTSRRATILASDTARSWRESASRELLVSSDTRDKVLLGVAGLAVAGALGIAFQKRVSEERVSAGGSE